MKLLFVTPRFPYPPLKGDQVVSYHRLRTLSQQHEITLLTFYQNSEELENIKYIKTYCKNIHTVKIPKWQSFFNLAKGVFSYLPLQVSYYYSNTFRNKVNQILSTNNFDVIHLFLLRIAPYFTDVSTPKIIELIDSMQLNLERRIALDSFPVRNILQEELQRIIHYEQNLHKSFEQIVVVSEKDAKLIPGQNVQVIPNGIDTELFKQQQQYPINSTLIFSGNMSYAPNIHAVKWFTEHCLPIIQQTIPDVSFIIAGANPSKEVQSLGQTKGVKVTGFVKSMSDTLRSANVAVAPMQSGSGIQNKILEAMSTGLPVVTTNLGLGSIKAKPNKEILVADTPEDFAQKTIDLLHNSLQVREIGHQARKYVVDNHSWDFAANQIEQLYYQILSR
ncbi:MAG: glycosyltransferase [Nostocales cyanobacterium 94392]|nr:glycosyltransferase [Nostocales cyanobacterium 94392]